MTTTLDLAADRSPFQILASLDPDERKAWLDARVADGTLGELLRSWAFYQRPSQATPPGAWRLWLLLTGRGFGKSRTAAEWLIERCEVFAATDHPHSIGLLGAKFSAIAAIVIPALEQVCRRKGYHLHHPPTALVGYIDINGHRSEFEFLTAQDPDGPRGRNLHTILADELAAWPQKTDAEGGTVWTNADLALRAECPDGLRPQAVIATTPKPVKTLKDIVAGDHGPTHTTRGSLLQNAANLDPSFVAAIVRRYGGTRLGLQEIEGVLLDDIVGALLTGQVLSTTRLDRTDLPDLHRIVVAVDPSGGGPDEVGIVVAGAGWAPDGKVHLYVLADYSGKHAASDWPHVVTQAFHRHQADAIIAETNYGGDMVAQVIKTADPTIPYRPVRASRGKHIRAEPVANLFHQGRAHMVGLFPELEAQWCEYVPGQTQGSPDRLDACVWAGIALIDDLTATDTTEGHGTNISARRL